MTILSVILTWLVVVGTYQTVKPLPENININSADYRVTADELGFIGDITYTRSDSQRVSEQEIFDTIYDIIDTAEHYILLDMFLYNSDKGKDVIPLRPVSSELTAKLIAKRNSNPSIRIDLITDPVNTLYGGSTSEQFRALENAGVNVIVTDHRKLRDSNPIYSSIWRTFFQWFGNSERLGFFPHPFGKDDRVTLRSYLSMMNMKANHRKLMIADSNGEMVTVVASANPHDASSAHSNVAVWVKGDIWKEIYLTEKAVATISKKELQNVPEHLNKKTPHTDSDIRVRVLSERSIRDEVYDILENAEQGDKISMAMFYLAERGTVKRLIKAAINGVDIRLILDPNKDAFGHKKKGIPNRPVANELLEKSDGKMKIRWYDTHGEQFHTKMLIYEKRSGGAALLLGSANLTRRNIENFNLELNLLINTKTELATITKAQDYFEAAWDNREQSNQTVPFERYSENSALKTIIYRIQEFAGLSSF
jgi:hypothetical protein